jgi:hypothetical protein
MFIHFVGGHSGVADVPTPTPDAYNNIASSSYLWKLTLSFAPNATNLKSCVMTFSCRCASADIKICNGGRRLGDFNTCSVRQACNKLVEISYTVSILLATTIQCQKF